MNDLKPLLSDEEIREAAGIFARQFGLLPGGNVAMDFSSGARFARTIYEAERNRLLDEIERLEAMVPKWVQYLSTEQETLLNQGWSSGFDVDVVSGYYVLMVPPIPLPEKHEEKGSE